MGFAFGARGELGDKKKGFAGAINGQDLLGVREHIRRQTKTAGEPIGTGRAPFGQPANGRVVAIIGTAIGENVQHKIRRGMARIAYGQIYRRRRGRAVSQQMPQTGERRSRDLRERAGHIIRHLFCHKVLCHKGGSIRQFACLPKWRLYIMTYI